MKSGAGELRILSWFFGERFTLGADFDRLLRIEFRERLIPLSVVVAGLYSLLAICHPIFVEDARAANVLMAGAAGSSLIAIGGAFYVSWKRPANQWVHVLGVLITFLMSGNSGLHLALTEDAIQSTNFLLVVIGVGCVFDYFRFWFLCISVALLTWLCCGPLAFETSVWSHYGFMLLMASLLSAMLFSVRIRHRVRLELSHRETERKASSLEASNAALREVEQRLHEAQEIAQVGSWHYTSEANGLWLSPAVFRILGESEQSDQPHWTECVERVCAEDRDRVEQAVGSLLSSGGKTELEFSITRADGLQRTILFRGQTQNGAGAGLRRLTGTVQDVTAQREQQKEREKLEDQLRSAQRMDALGTMAGGIAHDFNNILFSILGNAQLAEMDVPEEHPARRSLTNIVAASKRARDVVRQILTFSQRQEVSVEETNLGAVVGEVLDLLRASMPPSIEILTKFEENCPAIAGDQSQIHQILVNLCSNAVDAMKDSGGILKISVRTVWSEQLPENLQAELGAGPHVGLRVEDSGVGMGEATTDRIFEPFFTTKTASGGTGLGLSVVHGIVKSHQGAIAVKSRLGQGTVFDLYFPVLNETLEKEVVEKPEMRRGRGERVLLVDDEQPVLRAVAALMERLGYRVTECTNPLDCERLFKRFPVRFDIVVTDLRMREMLGTELARRISRIREGIPIVLITGHAQELKKEDLVGFGISSLLQKPSTIEALASTMAEALNRPSGGGAAAEDSSVKLAS